jgi:hypothetical protein
MVGARKWRLAESGEAQLPGSRSREPSPCAALVRCLVALFCELEVGSLEGAVVQLDDELAAGVPLSLAVCLPDVGVGVGERVVGEAAAAGGDGFFDSGDGVGGVARDRLGLGVAVAKIVVPWFPPRLNFDGDGLPGLDGVEGGRVVDR